MAWDPRLLPSQHGKTVVVTGGARGVGYFIGEQLAVAGARLIIAARSVERADAAALIRERAPHAQVEHLPLDLASLSSIRAAASPTSARLTCWSTTPASPVRRRAARPRRMAWRW